jgi:hypothetical protein
VDDVLGLRGGIRDRAVRGRVPEEQERSLDVVVDALQLAAREMAHEAAGRERDRGVARRAEHAGHEAIAGQSDRGIDIADLAEDVLKVDDGVTDGAAEVLCLPGGCDRLDQAGVENLAALGLDRCDDARQVTLPDVDDVRRVSFRLLLALVALEPVEMAGERVESARRSALTFSCRSSRTCLIAATRRVTSSAGASASTRASRMWTSDTRLDSWQ